MIGESQVTTLATTLHTSHGWLHEKPLVARAIPPTEDDKPRLNRTKRENPVCHRNPFNEQLGYIISLHLKNTLKNKKFE